MEYILPDHLFDGLPSALLLLILAVAIAALAKGADWLVTGAVALSKNLGIPPAIVGATVVSLGTTMPEMAVSVLAAWKGMPDFALGNSVGSIICDTALIFGLACMMTRIPIDRFLLNRHGWVQLGAGVLLILVCLPFRDGDGNPVIPRFIGFFFIALLGIYLLVSFYWARQQGRVVELE
ncbi:MAG: sodium:calcium antiporter [Candidatus Sumerlaeia bacterium]|nr:sodium:calcium antiporter [Candidatus Sumerlaeia bacterium]